jgi:predicted lipid-binding transport protein (Tim44 family)
VPQDGQPQTAVDKAVQRCVGTVLVGAVGGALIGAAAGGKRGAATGGLIGGGAGGAMCAVMLAVANKEDRERIRAIEQAAVSQGASKSETYVSQGVPRRVETKVSAYSLGPSETASVSTGEAEAAAPGPKVCRYAETTIEVAGKGTANTGKQLYCRADNGDWAPVAAVS